jgi:hypothetical protein
MNEEQPKKEKPFKKEENDRDSSSPKPVEKKGDEAKNIDPEIKSDINRFHELHDKLQSKLDKLYKETGITHKDIQRYLDDPSNYDEGEWEYFQQRRKLFNEGLMTKLDPNLVKTTARKLKKKSGKKLRGRAIGRKRKWLDMG